MPPAVTREDEEALATYIRQKLHKDASSNVRHNDTASSVEIEIVHPKHGPRVVAFSDELLEDSDLDQIKRLIDRWNIVGHLGTERYLAVVVTNDGLRSYPG